MIFGESAGAAPVMNLLISPLLEGSFIGLSQSGAFALWTRLEDALRSLCELLNTTGCARESDLNALKPWQRTNLLCIEKLLRMPTSGLFVDGHQPWTVSH